MFEASARLDDARGKARDMLFSGQVDQAIDHIESVVAELDERFAAGDGVPRYFNSYADRVIYNHLFAIRDERTVLIPDNLFYAHMELADALAQLKGAKAALPHLTGSCPMRRHTRSHTSSSPCNSPARRIGIRCAPCASTRCASRSTARMRATRTTALPRPRGCATSSPWLWPHT